MLEKYKVSNYDSFYKKEIVRYFDTIEEAFAYMGSQLNARVELMLKLSKCVFLNNQKFLEKEEL